MPMRVPKLRGVIRRRMLINFRVEPDAMQRLLPKPFVPKLQGRWAVAGICLIRLEQIRPHFVPVPAGLSSENAAHRVAVRWVEGDEQREGVFIPRRDSDSRLNHWVGGRLFPGEHHPAHFEVRDAKSGIALNMHSLDGAVRVAVRARPAQAIPKDSIFKSLEEVSAFFEAGSLGYSATTKGDHFDGLNLATDGWRVEALDVDEVHSSFFEDPDRFPPGSVHFDCALLMRDIPHTWQSVEDLPAATAPA
jgi:hypothetical protein